MSKSASSNSKAGLSFVGVIQIVFIILKCTKSGVVESWPWWKVMLPIICSIGLMCFFGCIACCGVIVTHMCYNDKKINKVHVEIPNKPKIVVSTCNNSTIYRVV